MKNDLNEARESGLNTYIYDGNVALKVSTNDHFTRRDARKMLGNIGQTGQLYTLGTPGYLINQDIGLKFAFSPMSYYIDSDDNGSYSMPQFAIEQVIPIQNPLIPTYEHPSDMPVFTGEPDYSHRNGPWIDVDAEERKVNNSDPAVISKRKAEEEAKRKAEEEAYATNHSFGLAGKPTSYIVRKVTPIIKSKKTGKVLKRGETRVSYRFTDPNMAEKINKFWSDLGLRDGESGDDFLRRITGYNGNLRFPFFINTEVPKGIASQYYTNKNGDIYFNNGDGVTIWNNKRARYKGRLMYYKDAIKEYILDKEKAERDKLDQDKINSYEPADSTANDSIARTNYGDSIKRVTSSVIDFIRSALFRPDSTVVRPDSTATR